MEILKIHINITETHEFASEDKTIRMILFDGFCEGDYFHGKILNGGVDTQIIGKDSGTLSARYMLKGFDAQKQPCSMYIENNGTFTVSETLTHPKIYTDSKKLKWLESANLIGRILNENNKLVIIISTRE